MVLRMSTAGDGLKANNASWEFGSMEAENFDSYARKSIPHYSEGHVHITKTIEKLTIMEQHFVKAYPRVTASLKLLTVTRIRTISLYRQQLLLKPNYQVVLEK
jgi:hypothetical protein